MDGLEGKVHVTTFKYEFAEHGGAIGAVTIQDKTIPDNAIILWGLIDDPTTDLAGATATVSLGIKSAGDLHAADAIADINGGPIECDQIGFGTGQLKTESQEGLIVTIAVAALTAGVFEVKVAWIHGS